jgi:type II secretory pathway component PulF
MSTLLESAITLPHALRVSSTSFGNLLFSNEIDLLSKRIEGGESFSGALKQSPIFPEEISEIMASAEESGELAQAFTRLSQTYKKETEVSRQVALAMIEPLLIVVMGLIVGFVALALLLPMMELNGVIR